MGPTSRIFNLEGFSHIFINRIESGGEHLPVSMASLFWTTARPVVGGSGPLANGKTHPDRQDSGASRDSFRDSSSRVRTHFRPSTGLMRGARKSKKPRKHLLPEASCGKGVGDIGLEPMTPSLSSWCSNQLS